MSSWYLLQDFRQLQAILLYLRGCRRTGNLKKADTGRLVSNASRAPPTVAEARSGRTAQNATTSVRWRAADEPARSAAAMLASPSTAAHVGRDETVGRRQRAATHRPEKRGIFISAHLWVLHKWWCNGGLLLLQWPLSRRKRNVFGGFVRHGRLSVFGVTTEVPVVGIHGGHLDGRRCQPS
ncbi:uncharacterized protein LOC126293360 [Schistocerca gregaria]|uniref:uncharacterized protein LOC126293360 n=1 Tax=Schistocerca gregaria TaxID=7010 RepID=UPI00211F15FB|nr:uncharacterized protein LOC126293360 [Schistocerca gregaria]